MSQSWIIGIFSFIVLVAIAVLFLYLNVKGLHDEAIGYWRQILDKLRLRDDMVPNLVETIRHHVKNQEKLIDEMAMLRSKSWPMEKPNAQKVDVELNLTEALHSVWNLVQHYSTLNTDTNFLSLKTDFQVIGKEIDEMADVYNDKIRGYNNRIEIVFLKPLFQVLGLKKAPIFEFEP